MGMAPSAASPNPSQGLNCQLQIAGHRAAQENNRVVYQIANLTPPQFRNFNGCQHLNPPAQSQICYEVIDQNALKDEDDYPAVHRLQCSNPGPLLLQRAAPRRCSLVPVATVHPPTTGVTTVGVVVSLMDHPTLRVPLVLAVEGHTVSHGKRIDPRRQVDIVRQQQRLPILQPQDEALMPAAIEVVSQDLHDDAFTRDLNVTAPSLVRTGQDLVARPTGSPAAKYGRPFALQPTAARGHQDDDE